MPGHEQESSERSGRRWSRWIQCGSAAAGVMLVLACERQEPPMREAPAMHGPPVLEVQTSGLQAGPQQPTVAMPNPYEDNRWAIRDGERMYGWFNCDGCHGALGGGGIGPPFADDDWIYGGEPASIYQSIVQGRPEGMPAFGGKIPPSEIWKITAYVRSLAGHGPEPPGLGPPAASDEAPGGGEGENGPGGSGSTGGGG